jgi:hypothetical protein
MTAAEFLSLLAVAVSAFAIFSQRRYVASQAESETADAAAVNTETAMKLLEKVKIENADLSTRLTAMQVVASALEKEMAVVRAQLTTERAGVSKLYYQVLALGERPLYVPPGVILADNKPTEPGRSPK